MWPPFPDACFYLEDAEIRALAAGELSVQVACETARQRADEVEAVRDMVVPDVVFGDEPAPFQDVDAAHLTGVATSSGRHTGRAVLIASASQARPVPTATSSWCPTPTSPGRRCSLGPGPSWPSPGGFLSHTSIVAREYGIPAVVSVTGAMRLLHDGDVVTVDGYTGTVTLSDAEEDRS